MQQNQSAIKGGGTFSRKQTIVTWHENCSLYKKIVLLIPSWWSSFDVIPRTEKEQQPLNVIFALLLGYKSPLAKHYLYTCSHMET